MCAHSNPSQMIPDNALSPPMKVLIIFAAILQFAVGRTDNINSNGVKSPPVTNCYDGTYAVRLPPFDSCSGFRKCEIGYYCEKGVKNSCPAGSYGDRTGLNSSSCSGQCPDGFYCPEGTTSAESNFCGSANLYCPLGSAVPEVASPGYYTVDAQGSEEVDTALTRSRQIVCPRGYFCSQGVKKACPGGTYGSSEGLDTSACSGLCPEGWYCPSGSVQPYAFSCISGRNIVAGKTATKHCPEGSDRPIPTAEGYYAVSSHAEVGGGYGSQLVCPRGSYCLEGIRHPCPAGRYGVHLRGFNASCSGACTAGYYCPEGSITDKQVRCPDAASYCPTGSPAPVLVSPGYYTVGHETSNYTFDVVNYDGNPFSETARTSQAICEPGYYCLSDGIKRKCPIGRYGSTQGLSTPSCSGYCAPGFYCEEGSPTERQYPCGGADRFCPPGSAVAQIAHIGYYTMQQTDGNPALASAERRCEPGFYCQNGVKALCTPGTWGGEFGLHRANCSGLCAAGHYCPEGSISPVEKFCGDADKYCPGGDFRPVAVSLGYFSTGGNASTRTGQEIAPPGHYAFNGILYVCPAGFYGATYGLSSATCSGPCAVPGYYCPAGSTSPVMRYCGGDDVFCPPFTVAPINVHSGFYTADYLYEECPPGQWRNLTLLPRSADPTDHSPIVTQQPLPLCQLCPNGTYKSISGDHLSQCRACEQIVSVSSPDHITCDCMIAWGTGYTAQFNITTGKCQKYRTSEIPLIDAHLWLTNTSLTRHRQLPCDAGHYCEGGRRYKCPPGRYGALTQETRPLCEGVCTQGFYCLESSTSPTSYPCGGSKWICPEGSHTPLLVPPGWYSNEDVPEKLRYSSKICPKGYYCPGDGKRYACSKGTYTDKEGTVDAACMGPCERGHYCYEASTNRTQHQCGNTTVYCPRGSFEPTLIKPGFYGLFTGADAGETRFWSANNATYSVEVPCEPGYFCNGGVKNACPPGTFGWRFGMTNAQCGGQCAAGYYCPSYMAKQPDAPTYTVWPGKPHLTATDLECGRVGYYCPQGSFYPLLVGGGNYSIGGSAHNRTRVAQVICPPGSYCADSIAILCPMGRYGSTAGLKDASCTGLCPAGFYCPGGSVTPTKCPPTQYSTGRAAECSVCPGTRTTPLLCQTDKSCCFRG